MKPSGSACIVTDLRRKWLLALPEYGGFGNRPGFGLNTNKASIKLTFFCGFFGCSIKASRSYERRCGRASVIFFRTELTLLRALSLRTFGEKFPSSWKSGAVIAAKGDDDKMICPLALESILKGVMTLSTAMFTDLT